MENNQNAVTLKAKQIYFTSNYMEIIDSCGKQYQIPYKELVIASLRAFHEESNTYYEPEITEITKDMDGELMLYNSQHTL